MGEVILIYIDVWFYYVIVVIGYCIYYRLFFGVILYYVFY